MGRKSGRHSEREPSRQRKRQVGSVRSKNDRSGHHVPRSSKSETSVAARNRASDGRRRKRLDCSPNTSSQSTERACSRAREGKCSKGEARCESSSTSSESECAGESERPNARHGGVEKQPETEEEKEEYGRKVREWRMREKMTSYEARLKLWVRRERFMAKERKRKRLQEKLKQIEAAKMTRLLSAFMEHYNDERDDGKYYSGGALWTKMRYREKELAFDIRDRARERKELKELRLKETEKDTSCDIAEEKLTASTALPGDLKSPARTIVLSDEDEHVEPTLGTSECTATLSSPVTSQSVESGLTDKATITRAPSRSPHLSLLNGHVAPTLQASHSAQNLSRPLNLGSEEQSVLTDAVTMRTTPSYHPPTTTLSQHVVPMLETTEYSETLLPPVILQPGQSDVRDEVPGTITSSYNLRPPLLPACFTHSSCSQVPASPNSVSAIRDTAINRPQTGSAFLATPGSWSDGGYADWSMKTSAFGRQVPWQV